MTEKTIENIYLTNNPDSKHTVVEKTFEELFPSLKDIEIDFGEIVDTGYERKLVQLTGNKLMIRVSKQVQKHCIDKKRLKEMILDESLFPVYDKHYRKYLINKLGLEDE